MSKECKDKEWYRVIEIADLLSLSKVSIYNKIKTIESETLQPLQRKEKGITYYHAKLIDILRDTSSQQTNTQEDISQEEAAADIVNDNYADLYISELKSEIEFLKEQIRNKDGLLEKHVKLIENEQVLRREEQRAIIMLEEARAKEVDEKITSWRKEHFTEQKNEDGFLKRLFKRKV